MADTHEGEWIPMLERNLGLIPGKLSATQWAQYQCLKAEIRAQGPVPSDEPKENPSSPVQTAEPRK